MPRVVSVEDRRQAAAQRKPGAWQRALACDDDEECEAALNEVLRDQELGANTTTFTEATQRFLIDFSLSAQEWYEVWYQEQNRQKRFDRQYPTPSDFFDFEDVPALIHRATAYLSFRRKYTVASNGVGKPTIKTVKCWAFSMIANARLYIQRRTSAADVAQALSRVLRFDGTGEKGLYRRVMHHALAMIEQHHLPKGRPGSEDEPWSRLEVELMARHINEKMKATGPEDGAEIWVQRLLLILIPYHTGLRVGSLGAGFTSSDIRIQQPSPGQFNLVLTISTLKGWNGLDQRAITPRLRGAFKKENLILDPTPALIAMLIHRKALFAKGSNDPITTVDELISSDAAEFEGRGNVPVFRGAKLGSQTLTDEPLRGPTIGLAQIAQDIGLQASGFHQLRKSFARNISVTMGSSVARIALDHDMRKNVTERVYTSGPSAYDFSAIRYGEIKDSRVREKLSASTIQAAEMFGQGMRAMKAQSSAQGPSKKGIRTKDKRDDLQEIRFRDAEFKALHDELNKLRADLEKKANISFDKLQTFGQAQIRRARTELEKKGLPTKIAEDAETALHVYQKKSLQLTPKAKITARKEKADQIRNSTLSISNISDLQLHQKNDAAARIKTLKLAAQAEMQRVAEATLPGVRKDDPLALPVGPKFSELSNVTTSTTSALVVGVDINGPSNIDEREASRVPSVLRVREEDTVDDDEGQPNQEEDVNLARLALIRYYLGVQQPGAKEASVRAFMERFGVCCFCDKTRVLVLCDSKSIIMHLLSMHPGILEAIRAGADLHPGTIANPLASMGSLSISPWAAGDKELARRYHGPPSSNLDPAIAKVWLGPDVAAQTNKRKLAIAQQDWAKYLNPVQFKPQWPLQLRRRGLPHLPAEGRKLDGSVNANGAISLAGSAARRNRSGQKRKSVAERLPGTVASMPLGSYFKDQA